ncbi:protein CD300H-like [Mauremys mutica]|uniref:protein CD300H-like n=1 Tax=Mauremys mutica TaxID=74926 RepID=UPI001D162824|nr:protein CD300H-like [Mauremys mutica]
MLVPGDESHKLELFDPVIFECLKTLLVAGRRAPRVSLSLSLAGCWAVTGPGAVRGPAGGSVAVRCRYRAGYEDYPKFWCRAGLVAGWSCSDGLHIVETDGSEAEVTRGRVSIRDDRTQRVFTVTVENLTPADAGTYHCGVDRIGLLNPRAAVTLTVSPDNSSLFLTVRTSQATMQPDLPSPTKTESSFSPTTHITPARFQLIILCFLLLGLSKGLLLLCIVSVRIWMSVRYRRSHREMVPDRQAHEPPLC